MSNKLARSPKLVSRLDSRSAVLALKAAADPTRLRILALLASGELNVSDLTRILGQSQPRISRHLKLLAEAGLVDRVREGSWVYCHLTDRAGPAELARGLVRLLDNADRTLERDRLRAEAIKAEREQEAQAFFREHAAEWDQIRSLHVAEAAVEAAIREALGAKPFGLLVDLGTGTGRMLELLADRYARGLGIDVNHAMLSYARSRLESARLTSAQVRHGDIYNLAVDDGQADGVVMHQVLHFLSEPGRALAEAARILAPGGRLLIVDFAPHGLEFLRDRFKHERLGFSGAQIGQWLKEAGLEPALQRELPQPEPDGERLTVAVWLAERTGAKGRRREAARQLETVKDST